MTRLQLLALLSTVMLCACARSHMDDGRAGDGTAAGVGGVVSGGASGAGTGGGGEGGAAGTGAAGSEANGETIEVWRGELRSFGPFACHPNWDGISPYTRPDEGYYREPVTLALKRDHEHEIVEGLLRIGEVIPESTPRPAEDANEWYWLCVQTVPISGVTYPIQSWRETSSRLTFDVLPNPEAAMIGSIQRCHGCGDPVPVDLAISVDRMEGTIWGGGGLSSQTDIRLVRAQ